MKRLTIALAVVLAAGCAHQTGEVRQGSAEEADGVILVHNNYVQVQQVPEQAWGEFKFVPGHARQGVIVTPSRTWTYGQGPGFENSGGIDMQAMAGNSQPYAGVSSGGGGDSRAGVGGRAADIFNCPGLSEWSHAEKVRIGTKHSHLPRSEVMRKPLGHEFERLVEQAVNSGCLSLADARQRAKDLRWAYVQIAREAQSVEKGGTYIKGQDRPERAYHAPPEPHAATDSQPPTDDSGPDARSDDEQADSGDDQTAAPDDPVTAQPQAADQDREAVGSQAEDGEQADAGMAEASESSPTSPSDQDIGAALDKPLPDIRVQKYEQ